MTCMLVRNWVLLHLPLPSEEGRWWGSGHCYPLCHWCLACLDSESHPELSSSALTLNNLGHIVKVQCVWFLTSKIVLICCLKGRSRKLMGFNA